MGYRSDVAVKCEEKAYELFKKAIADGGCRPDKIFKEGDYFIIYWEWMKWYEDEDDVSAIMDVIYQLDANFSDTPGFGYKYIRIGEDSGDEESSTNNYDIELYVTRKIDIPENLERIV